MTTTSPRGQRTRASSTESSVLSNILVANIGSVDSDSENDNEATSTPPTSLSGSIDNLNKAKTSREPRRKSVRATSGASSNYNLKELSDAQFQPGTGSRNVSGLTGQTLVEGEEEEQTADKTFGNTIDKALDMDWELAHPATRKSPRRPQRKPSVKDKIKKAVKEVGSVLGKRGRGAVEAGKRSLTSKRTDPKQEKLAKELDVGPKGVLDELDLDADLPAPPLKKARTSKKSIQDITQPAIVPLPISETTKRMKKWQKAGLYVGQEPEADRTQKPAKKAKPDETTQAGAQEGTPKKNSFMPLPMFSYLDAQRDFKIPFDIFAPSLKKGDAKPKDWHQLNRNRLIGDAKDLWEKPSKPQEMSYCQCQPGEGGIACDEDCHNRLMLYECTPENCRLSEAACGNREFAELGKRTKKGGAFDVGVEVVKTDSRGFGIRSCRTFAPGQLIMEYTGEIITEEECQRRMQELYKDKQCYYLMEMAGGLVIDGTKGSMARFINHSCAPNCDVRMLKVNGTLRMGVFAGEQGIFPGEELSYDYNFDNFGETKQLCYCGAETCRGYLGPRLNATEQKKQRLEADAKKRAAAEEAHRHALEEAKKQKIKQDRGSGWRGWLAVDDPDTKARLKAEKAAKEERERNSSRAQRLLQRKRGASDAAESKPALKRVEQNKRRKTTSIQKTKVEAETTRVVFEEEEIIATPRVSPRKTIRAVSASRFSEDLPRPASQQSNKGTIVRQRTSIAITEEEEIIQPSPSAADTSALVTQDDEADDISVIRKKSTSDNKRHSLIDVAKSMSNAVKNSLKGGSVSSSSSASSAGKLRQSTLSFAKLSS